MALQFSLRDWRGKNDGNWLLRQFLVVINFATDGAESEREPSTGDLEGIMPFNNRFQPIAFALFRIVFGLLFLQFGTQKLFAWPNSPTGYTPTALLRVAACIELTCGFLIMIGLLAEFAAFVAAGEMAFAYFLGHFPIAFWPVVSRGVPAVLFCFAFLFVAAHGAGQWSVDNLWRKRLASQHKTQLPG